MVMPEREMDLENTQPQSLKRTWRQRSLDPFDSHSTSTRSNKIFKNAEDKLCFETGRGFGFNHKNGAPNNAQCPGGLSLNFQPKHVPSCHNSVFHDESFQRTLNQMRGQNIPHNHHISHLQHHTSPCHGTNPRIVVYNNTNSTSTSHEQVPKQLQPDASLQNGSVSSSSQCPECAAGKPGHIGHLGRSQQMDVS